MSRNRLCALAIGVIVLFLNAGLSLGQTRTFVFIVHSSNTVQELSRADVSRLFLRRTTRWEDGQKVLPVNLVEASPLRVEFSREINHKSVAAEKAFYQRLIFTGRGVPPVEFHTEDDVVTFVARKPGAICYISRSKLTEEVREIKIRDSADQGE